MFVAVVVAMQPVCRSVLLVGCLSGLGVQILCILYYTENFEKRKRGKEGKMCVTEREETNSILTRTFLLRFVPLLSS